MAISGWVVLDSIYELKMTHLRLQYEPMLDPKMTKSKFSATEKWMPTTKRIWGHGTWPHGAPMDPTRGPFSKLWVQILKICSIFLRTTT